MFSYKGIDYFVFFEDHPDPHFTVLIDGKIYKFRISDLACISGPLPGEGDWLKILKGAKKNKQKLAAGVLSRQCFFFSLELIHIAV